MGVTVCVATGARVGSDDIQREAALTFRVKWPGHFLVRGRRHSYNVKDLGRRRRQNIKKIV